MDVFLIFETKTKKRDEEQRKKQRHQTTGKAKLTQARLGPRNLFRDTP
jgi:hypothetical protein